MRKFPCVFMRGGTSKGCMFLESDLPARDQWDDIFVQAMGSPDPKQIDGMGGCVSSNNKIVVVRKSDRPGIDVDYIVGQSIVGQSKIDYKSNCGNMTAATAPYAVEMGLVENLTEPTTVVQMPIIEKLDALARTRTEDEGLAIIDKDDRVHMAHMDIHFTHSTNGVAALHTEILKNSELHGFYELYPEKFNNKTNGITFRRWLLECDPALTAELEKRIGSGFRKDAAELEKLLAFAGDETVLNELTAVKKANKEALADWLLHTQNVTVNTEAVFDIQSKRLHEYKRQQLNLLYLIHQYHEIKAGHLPAVPLVSIFGAKAAPAYTIAKDIIHALLALSKVIAADPEVSKWLQVVFIENYNVTAAEKLIPACDLSEQISLASKEASGTGNMKFMLNGALTLGTMDGANVEISQQVGEENIYIFGQTSDQVIHRYAVGDYDPAQWVEGDANIRRAIGFLTGPEMLAAGHAENLTRLHDELIRKDWFQTLPDFNAYVVRKGQALSDYACDPLGWCKKCLVNIAKAGFFSSDRTIAEYDRDIWHLGQ